MTSTPAAGLRSSMRNTMADGVALVRSLVREQFPEYAAMAIEVVDSSGTDHEMFRLGPNLVVRLPRTERAEAQVLKEQKWLPRLAEKLPLKIPTPVRCGLPGARFEMHWSIYGWLDGENAIEADLANPRDAAQLLGGFGAALRSIDATDAPPCMRGTPLADQQVDILAAINDLGAANIIDRSEALDAWQIIKDLPQWKQAPVWAHSDLLPGNLLVHDGRLHAVIDFGCAGVGDPACDLMPAFTLFDPADRSVFREFSDVDDATWERGRAWAFGFGLMAYHFHHQTNPVLASVGLHSLREALRDIATND